MKRLLFISVLLLGVVYFATADRRGLLSAGEAQAWTFATPTNGLLQHLSQSVLTGSAGDPFATWTATAGRDATNTGATDRPLLRFHTNGNAYLEFDGSNDYLRTANWASAPSALPVTTALAFRKRTIGSTGYFHDGNNAANDPIGIFENIGLFRLNAGGTARSMLTADTNWHTLIVEWNDASTRFSIDNSAWTNISSPGSLIPTGLHLGSASDLSLDSAVDIMTQVTWFSALGATDFAEATNLLSRLVR